MRAYFIKTLFVLLLAVPGSRTSHASAFFSASTINKTATKDSITHYLDSARTLGYTNGLGAIGLANRAIELSIISGNTWGEASGYATLAKIQNAMKHGTLALDNYSRSISAFLRMRSRNQYDNAQLSQDYIESCTILISLNQYAEARQKLNSIPAEAWNSFSQADKFNLNVVQVRLQIKQKQYSEALALLGTMQSEKKSNGDSKGLSEIYQLLGDLYLAQNDKTQAENYYLESKKTAESIGFMEGVVRSNEALARLYGLNNDLDREISMRSANLTYNQSNNNYQAITEENYQIGNAYFNNDQLEEAGNYYGKLFEPAQVNASEIPDPLESSQRVQLTPLQYRSVQLEQGSNAFRQLAEGYFKKNDLDKALDSFKKYTQLQDSIKDVHQKELAEAIALSTALGKNEERISLLEKERLLSNKSLEVLQLDKSIQQQQLFNRNLVIGVLAFVLVFLTGGGLYLIRSTQARRKADKLLALQSLSGQMNPHFIFNALNSVNEYISLNDERSANRYLSEFSKLMRRVMDDSRHTFIPLQEEIEMLRIYLQLEHSRFKNIFSYDFEMEESIHLADFEIPPMMVQPYLENAIWHGLRYRGEGGLLRILFARKGQDLCITIEDNGIGMEKSKALKTKNQKKQNSLGMKNIQTRVGLMNDIYQRNIEIQVGDSQSGAEYPGTRVVILIPQITSQSTPLAQ